MLLSELLTVSAVTTRLKAVAKRDAVAELVGVLEAGHGVDSRGEILDRVLRREAMMSTGIGNGVAIPHGKARAVDRMMAACAVSPAGVDFEAVDGEPAYLFILLVSPESVGTPHVKVLANISRLLKEEPVRRSLRDADSATAFLTALKSAETKYLAAASS
jgi:mannitol/fructose-specific phosphotransferase system IIA component (Ntr-type)